MESQSVEAVLKATDQGFTSSMLKAQGSLQGLEKSSGKAKSSIMEIAEGVGVFKVLSTATNALSNALDGAINRYDTMNRFPTVMKQMGFETDQSEQAISRLSKGIDGLPTTLDGVVSTTQRLASTTGNLDKSVNTTLALNNALIASGATADQTARATDQYVKILSTGKVEADSWQTLSETMSYALKEVAVSFGFAGDSATNDLYAALQDGDITMKDFNSRMIELSDQTGGFAEIAQTSAGGIATSFQNIQTAVVRGTESMIRAIDEGLVENGLPNLQGALDIAKGGINDFFGVMSSGAKSLISTVAPAIKAVAGNMDIIVPVVTSATAGFLAFKAATSLQGHFKSLKESINDTNTVLDKIKNSNTAWTLSAKDAQKAAEKQSEAATAVEKAYDANEKSIISAVQANQLDEAAKKASEKAAKAQAQAELLSKEAADKKKAAVSAGTKQEELSSAAKKASEAAAKAQARAELLSAEAVKKQELAQKAGAEASKAKTKAETLSTAAEKASEAAAKASVVQLSLKQAVLGVLRGKISATTVAQQALNTAFKANPIGAIITVISALVTALTALDKWLIKNNEELQETKKEAEKTNTAVEDLTDTIDSSADAHAANLRNIDAEAVASEALIKKITTLAKKEKLSKEEKKELGSMINQLNGSVEGLNLAYDEQTRSLNMTDEAIRATIGAYKEQEKAQDLQERQVEIIKEQEEAAHELIAVQKQRKEVGEQLEEHWWRLTGAGKELKKTDEELAESEESLKQRQEDLTVALAENETQIGENAKKRVEAEQKVSDAVNNSVQEQIISYDMLNDEQKTVVDSLNETWQSYVDNATNMFDVLSDKSELSVAQMTKNLEENQRVISEWSQNIATLAERGIDQGLLEQLRQAGPESAGYVKAMVEASDGELQTLSEKFANGATVATNSFNQVLDTSGMQESVKGFVFKQKSTMQEAIAEADFQSIGKSVGDGYQQGISENSAGAADAAGNMVKNGIDSAQTAQDSHSPSVVYEGLGADAIAGYILGVQGQQGGVIAAVSGAVRNGMEAARSEAISAIDAISSATQKSFIGMISATSSAMSAIGAGISSGMSSANRAIQTSMSQNRDTVNSTISDMVRNTDSGMSEFVRILSSGMSNGVNVVQQGKSEMEGSVSALEDDFYRAGEYASRGLANGINAEAAGAIRAARSVARSVATAMRSELDIHSPSKVTTRIGEYAGEGPAIGLLNMLSTVKKASDKVADAMIPGSISNAVSKAGSYVLEADYKVNSKASAPSNGNFDYNRFGEAVKEAVKELKVEVRNIMDAREVGYGTAKYVDAKNAKTAKLKNRLAGI